jgi:hypothetical protein
MFSMPYQIWDISTYNVAPIITFRKKTRIGFTKSLQCDHSDKEEMTVKVKTKKKHSFLFLNRYKKACATRSHKAKSEDKDRAEIKPKPKIDMKVWRF